MRLMDPGRGRPGPLVAGLTIPQRWPGAVVRVTAALGLQGKPLTHAPFHVNLNSLDPPTEPL